MMILMSTGYSVLNAPGGYGKTFLIEALLSTVRGLGQIALAVSSLGIASELLEGGRTVSFQIQNSYTYK